MLFRSLFDRDGAPCGRVGRMRMLGMRMIVMIVRVFVRMLMLMIVVVMMVIVAVRVHGDGPVLIDMHVNGVRVAAAAGGAHE